MLREISAERLLAGTTPERGSPEATITKALNAAMDVIAADLASTADDAIAAGAREADTRLEASDARRLRAQKKVEIDVACLGAGRDAARQRATDADASRQAAVDDAARRVEASDERARETAAEVTSVRERCAALERARALADAARERAGTNLVALRRGDEPKIVRLLEILEEAETRCEQEDDRPSFRSDADVGDD